MSLALRIRVTWADDVIEDVVHESAVKVGAGAHADVVAPGEPDRLVRFFRGRRGYRMVVPAGAAERVEFPGEDPMTPEALAAGFERSVGVGCGRFVVGGAEVDFEVLRTERDFAWLYLTTGLASVALLALFAGFGYHIVRQWGDGRSPRWGEPTALGSDQAKFLRVTMAPTAQGASKLAAGEGLTLHGVVDSPLLRAAAPKKVVAEEKKPAARKKVARKPKVVPPVVDDDDAVEGAAVPQVVQNDDDSDDDKDADESADSDADSAKLLQTGQQALLAAELRSAIDSLTSAEKTDSLDYDNLNWLGLAHYFLGENAEAERRWEAALELDPSRPDAVNNLGGIARRRGDTDGEIAAYEKALGLKAGDCHALNSMALALAKKGRFDDARKTLAESDTACGGNYAYTSIQRAGILSLEGHTGDAMAELEKGLARVDTLIPIKEYEVEADLLLDPAFAPLRKLPTFETLTAKYLPRAVQSKAAIIASMAAPPAAKLGELRDPFADAQNL